MAIAVRRPRERVRGGSGTETRSHPRGQRLDSKIMKTMSTYVCLLKFTEQGARAMRKTAARAEQFRKAAKKTGVHVIGQYWTLAGTTVS